MAPARSAPTPPVPGNFFARFPGLAPLVIILAAFAAYHNSFNVPFVFDDELAIVGNPSLHRLWTSLWPPAELTGLPISGRPVVNFSLGLSYAISGQSVWSYHVFNLLVHVTAGIIFFGLTRRTLAQPMLAPRFESHAGSLALLIALVWTLHPLQTESVTYLSQRAEAMVGLLYLLTLWFSVRALEPGAPLRWTVAAALTCALGMMTKEVMISAPIVVALYARAFVCPSWRAVWSPQRRLLLALTSTWLVLVMVVLHEGGARGASAGFGLGVSAWTYLLTQCEAIVLYLKLSLWPGSLVLDYGTHLDHSLGEVWWQALLIVALLVGTAWALVRRPIVGFLGAVFFLILAPSSSIVPLVGQTIAEHRMYLPLAAVVVVVGSGAYFLFGRLALIGLAVAALALGVTTERRNRDYATAIRICEDTVTKRPDNARAKALLADYYHRAGRLDDARAMLERSLEIEPGVRAVINNLGTVWLELGESAKAVACFESVLKLRPGDLKTMNNLGNALVLSGRMPEGIAMLQSALAADPTATETRFNFGSVLAQNQRFAEAAVQFEAVLKVHPTDVETLRRYSEVLLALGRKAESLQQLAAAVRLQPEDADLHNRLGTALGRSGRLQEALEQFDAALKINPAHEAARQNAARARQMLDIR